MENGPAAMIFDLDGVITFTARVHAAAWKQLFDDYLRQRSDRLGIPFHAFDIDSDYHNYVDGKPRYDGVLSFLASRNIHIPYGAPTDSPTAETVCGLGNRKNDLFNQKIDSVGVDVDQDAVRFVRELRDRGVRIGLASSSKNAIPILRKAGIVDLFEAIVDGIVSERAGLMGKPEPDIFLHCLKQLDASAGPQHAGIAEDAISGVEAGQHGGFALVLGVDRHSSGELGRHGANWVIDDFREITADEVFAFFSRIQVA